MTAQPIAIMNKLTKPEHGIASKHIEWKGYSLDELEQCRLVNAVKSELIKEQIAVVYGTTASSLMGNGRDDMAETGGDWWTKFVSYAGYGIRAYKYIRTITDLYHRFKS